MASGPLTSWQIEGENVETVTDFIFLGSKITADGHCGHEIKRCLLLGRKAMTKLDSLLKSRNISLLARFWFFQYHAWIWKLVRKQEAERLKIDAFEISFWN